MNSIEQYIQTYFGLQGERLQETAALFHPEAITKGEFLLRAGANCQRLSFVNSGYFRMFALDEHGNKEVTQWISWEGYFVTDLASFLFDQPARWNIQALSDGHIHTISKQDYRNLANYSQDWPRLERLFLAKCFVTIENRVFQLLSMTAEERYLFFFNQHPKLFNQVPLQYIASLLGMTPETLSRIRKKMA